MTSTAPNIKERRSMKLSGILFSLVVTLSFFGFVGFAQAATQWVNNPASCNIVDEANFPGQNCIPENICGDNAGIAQCYNTAGLLPPAISATSNTVYSASYPNGGYILNCYAAQDSAEPFCDNNGSYWCNRSNTCYTTQQRDTVCTANTWATATCGACRTGYGDCNGDAGVCEVQYNVTNYTSGTNNHYGVSCLLADVRCDSGYYDCDASGVGAGNGCEELRSGACTTGGGLSGTWSCSVDAGGICTDGASNYTCVCVPPKQYFETGTEAQYATADPLLWGVQYGAGDLIHFGNGSNSDLFVVQNDGSVNLAQITAPGVTTDLLYNVAGSLYWNGTMIGAGPAGSAWNLTGNAGTDPLTNFIGTTDTQPLLFKTDNTERLRIDDGGSFGFNTDNPIATYDFYGPEYTSLMLHNPVSSAQQVAMILDGDYGSRSTYRIAGSDYGNIFAEDPTVGDHQFYVNSMNSADLNLGVSSNSSVMVIDNVTENVGIGTNTPSALLHVQGGSNGDAILLVDSVDGNGNGNAGKILIRSDVDNGGEHPSLVFSGNTGEYGMLLGSPNGLEIRSNGLTDIDFFTNDMSRMTIDANGNVGIGINTPFYPLHVKSDVSSISAYFETLGSVNTGLYIGNSSMFAADETGLYDIGADYPLVVFDGTGGLVHYTNHIAVDVNNGKTSIGSNGIDASAILNLESDNAGFLMPRMTTLQRQAIAAPSTGLQIYNTETQQFEYFDGVDWLAVGGGATGNTLYTADGSISANRNVTISDGNYLRFRDEQDDQNYLYFLSDYITNGNLRIGGFNNTEGGVNSYLEFKDNLNIHSEGGVEIATPNNQIDLMSSNSNLQIGGQNWFYDNRPVGSRQGLVYADDYSADFVDRSLVDKAYVDSVAGGGGSVVTDINFTVATTDGSFSAGGFVGYEAANYMCDAEYPGSYFCRTDEIIQFIRTNGSTGFTGLTAWIAEGPPGYTSNSNDCNGWTDNVDTKLGAFWQFTNPGGGMGWLTNCAVIKSLACCE